MEENIYSVPWRSRISSALLIRNQLVREALSEFLATFVLILIGLSSIAQFVLFENGLGTFETIYLAWGVAVAMAIYIGGGVSGGHINPAVSLAMAVYGRINWKQCIVFMAAQYLASFLGAAVVYFLYIEALNDYDGGVRTMATAGIFATYPQGFLSYGGGIVDQILGSASLILCVLALFDHNNMQVPKHMVPFLIGFLIIGISAAFGANCGCPINPARDFGPRLFSAIAGWGMQVFSRDHWWWVPIVGPHIGAILGGWLYFLFVGIHLDADVKRQELNVESEFQGIEDVENENINSSLISEKISLGKLSLIDENQNVTKANGKNYKNANTEKAGCFCFVGTGSKK